MKSLIAGSCPKFGLIDDWFYDFVIKGDISGIHKSNIDTGINTGIEYSIPTNTEYRYWKYIQTRILTFILVRSCKDTSWFETKCQLNCFKKCHIVTIFEEICPSGNSGAIGRTMTSHCRRKVKSPDANFWVRQVSWDRIRPLAEKQEFIFLLFRA